MRAARTASHRGRHLDRVDRSGQVMRPPLATQGLGLHQRLHGLLQEERIPLGPLDEERREPLEPGVLAEERSGGAPGRSPAATGRGGADCRPSCCPRRADTRGDSRPGGRAAPSGGSRRGCRGAPASRRRPSGDPRARGAGAGPEPPGAQSRLIASRMRWRRWGGSRACQGLSSTGTSSRARSAGRLGSSAGSSASEPPPHLLANRWRVVAVLDVEVSLEELDHGLIRRRLAIRERARVQDEPALAAMRLRDLPDEPRLADARLPDDGHDLAVAGRGPGQDVAHCSSSDSRPTSGRHGAARRQARALEPLEPVGRSARSLGGADRHQLEPSLEGPGGGGAHRGSCPARRPLTKVSSTAYARHVAATSITRASPVCPTRPRLAWIAIRMPTRSDIGEPRALGGLPHRDRGVGRPPRGVLDRLEPEGRDHPQRAQRLDAAAEALRLLDEHLEGRGDLGPERHRPRRHEGGPQERELAPFPGRRAPHRSRARRRRPLRNRAGTGGRDRVGR